MFCFFIYFFNLERETQFKMYAPFSFSSFSFFPKMPTAEHMCRKPTGPEHWRSHLPGDALSLALIQGQQTFSLKSQFRSFWVSSYQVSATTIQLWPSGSDKQPQTIQKWMAWMCSNKGIFKTAPGAALIHPLPTVTPYRLSFNVRFLTRGP